MANHLRHHPLQKGERGKSYMHRCKFLCGKDIYLGLQSDYKRVTSEELTAEACGSISVDKLIASGRFHTNKEKSSPEIL